MTKVTWFCDAVDTPAGLKSPYFLTQLNTLWPDLADSRQIHTDTEDGVVASMVYWEHPLRHGSPDVDWPPGGAFPSVLFEPAEGVKQDAVLPLTKGLLAVLRVRDDMKDYEVETASGRLRLMHWRLTLGCREYRFLQFTSEEIAHLRGPGQTWGFFPRKRLPRMARLLAPLYGNRPDVQDRLIAGDREAMESCWTEAGHLLIDAVDHAVTRHAEPTTPSPLIGTRLEKGINVVGFATGQFGVGEDARMATRVLLQAGLEPCVYEPPIPLAVAHRQSGWIERHMRSAPSYRFNLITLPAVDTLRLFFLQQADVLAGRYNICGWQWELPKWPTRWQGLMAMPDEIWAQSRFLQEMFSQATDKPVVYVPSAVDLPSFEPRVRQHFGLPEQPFAFLSVFDCNAWYQRKNPLAAVRAFQLAFPASERGVQLVVKMMNSRPEMPEHQELMRLAGMDDRIVIIDQFLSRQDMLALLDCADVFVSLHRSEGFGRVVAECMLLGKPVISTNYSGSVDFAHEGTAYVVNGPLIPLRKGDYADHEGQCWMDPDIELAASAMRRCLEDAEGTAAMAARGQAYMKAHHSIEAVARQYADRLKTIGVI